MPGDDDWDDQDQYPGFSAEQEAAYDKAHKDAAERDTQNVWRLYTQFRDTYRPVLENITSLLPFGEMDAETQIESLIKEENTNTKLFEPSLEDLRELFLEDQSASIKRIEFLMDLVVELLASSNNFSHGSKFQFLKCHMRLDSDYDPGYQTDDAYFVGVAPSIRFGSVLSNYCVITKRDQPTLESLQKCHTLDDLLEIESFRNVISAMILDS